MSTRIAAQEDAPVEALIQELERQLLLIARRERIANTTTAGPRYLDRSNYLIMVVIAEQGPRRIGEIATALDLDASTATRQIQSLVRLGLAHRSADPDDGRAIVLSLTHLGEATLTNAQSARLDDLRSVLAHWNTEDQRALLRLLAAFNISWSRTERRARLDHGDGQD